MGHSDVINRAEAGQSGTPAGRKGAITKVMVELIGTSTECHSGGIQRLYTR
jgi:hypothetical protein